MHAQILWHSSSRMTAATSVPEQPVALPPARSCACKPGRCLITGTHLGVVCDLGGAVALQLLGLVDPVQAHSPQDGLLVGAIRQVVWRGWQG